MNRAVFIDRDGVINVERGYVHRVEDFEFLPGVPLAMSALKAAGWKLVVVTNQAGVARGFYDEAAVHHLHAHMNAQLQSVGALPDAIYHCPHHPQGSVPEYARACGCRKPQPGLLLQAAEHLQLNLPACALVGDKASDLGAAQAAGVGHRLLVSSGHTPGPDAHALAHHTFEGLPQAADWLLSLVP